MRNRLLLTCSLVLAFTAPLTAQETIKLKNGQTVNGRATKYDGDKEILYFRTSDGKDVEYPVAQLNQRSVYLVYSSVVEKDDAQAQLQLANFARDASLWKHAVRRYGYAENADPALKPQVDRELAKLRKMAAAFCMDNANAAQAKGDLKEVSKWCSLLLEKLPDEPQAAQAAALLDKVYAVERNARDDELERKHKALLEKDAKRAKTHYDRMISRTHEGLTARSTSKSTSAWNGAIKDGEVVLKELDRLEKKYSDDQEVQDGVAKYRELTISQMVDVYLHMASTYTTRSSYNKAMRETNAALVLDPNNQRALAQRARIEEASAAGWGWRWN